MYANGDGEPEDYTEAAAWYRKAAEQGHADAQFTLGQMYFAGDDHAEASTWYRRAAEQGHVEALHKLGRMYHQGRGVPQNFAEAVAWYREVAEQGQSQALWYLVLTVTRK